MVFSSINIVSSLNTCICFYLKMIKSHCTFLRSDNLQHNRKLYFFISVVTLNMKGLRKIKTFVHINSTYNLQENIKENGNIIHPRLKLCYTNTSKQKNLLKQQEEHFYLELALSKTTKMPCFTSYAFVERVPLVVLKSFCLCDTKIE